MKINYSKGDLKLEIDMNDVEFKTLLTVLDDNEFEVPTFNKLLEYVMLTAINNSRKIPDIQV